MQQHLAYKNSMERSLIKRYSILKSLYADLISATVEHIYVLKQLQAQNIYKVAYLVFCAIESLLQICRDKVLQAARAKESILVSFHGINRDFA